jgi:transposase
MGKSNKKKIDTANSVKNSLTVDEFLKPGDPMDVVNVIVEDMKETAKQCDLRKVEDTSESRILDHEDFVRMSRRHA